MYVFFTHGSTRGALMVEKRELKLEKILSNIISGWECVGCQCCLHQSFWRFLNVVSVFYDLDFCFSSECQPPTQFLQTLLTW